MRVVKTTIRLPVEDAIRCDLCGVLTLHPEESDWVPSYWHGDMLRGPVCRACALQRLRMDHDDGELELISEEGRLS